MSSLIWQLALIPAFYGLMWMILKGLQGEESMGYRRGFLLARIGSAALGALTIVFCSLAAMLVSRMPNADWLDLTLKVVIYLAGVAGILCGAYVVIVGVAGSEQRFRKMVSGFIRQLHYFD